MSVGEIPASTVTELLTQLTAAERAGHGPFVRALRTEIFERGAAARAGPQADAAPSTVEYLLIAAMGRDLETAHFVREARSVYDAGRIHGERRAQPYWRVFFLARATHLALDQKNGEEAAALLSAMLDPIEARWERAATQPIRPPKAELRLADLRAQRLVALGRYLAHVGELDRAARSYRAALEVLREAGDPFLSVEGVRLALGEIFVDRGARRELAALIAEVRLDTGAQSAAWLQVEAVAAQTQGRFSESLALCDAIRAGGDADGEQRRETTSRQLELLVMLNRLSDAEAILPAADDPRLLALFAARSAWQDELPPSVVRMLASPSGDDVSTPTSADTHRDTPHPDVAWDGRGSRRFERIAHEWAIRSQALMLDVHRGPNPQLLDRLDQLLAWSTTIDSPVIEAERELLAATVSFYCQGEDVTPRAAEAERLFRALDMPHRARDACHLQGLRSSPDAEAARRREAELVEMMRDRLAPQDWRMYRLNKWDAISWQLRERAAKTTTSSAAATRALWIDLDRVWSGDAGQAPAARICASPHWLPRGAAVAHYMCLPDRIFLFVGHATGCTYHVLKTPRNELWRAAEALITLLQTARRQALALAGATLGQQLGLDLLLRSLPAGIDRLILVPDDILFHVPFAALKVDGDDLVNRIAVSLLPDPVWTTGRDADGRGRPRRALAVAIPHSLAPGLETSELPAAEEEASAIARLGRRYRRNVTVGATCDDARRRLPAADLAHFACHGRFDEGALAQSGLALADGWLDISKVEALSLERLRLAMIASCWAANARILPGSQAVGLPMAFLRAGAHAVVSALWEVPQAAGVEIASRVYTRLARLGPARALADTQRSLSRPSDAGNAPGEIGDWAGLLCYQRAVRPRLVGRLALRWRALVRSWRRVTDPGH